MGTSWNDPVIGLYCERTSEVFWAEPLNAVTNLAFLIAAWIGWQQRAALPVAQRSRFGAAMLVLTAVIGLGSFLFHTFATRWAMLADVVPIGVYMLLAVGAILRRILGLPPVGVALGLLLFLAAIPGTLVLLPPDRFSLSQPYLPALATLALCACAARWRNPPAAPTLLAATITFAASLTFRTLDKPLCPTLPFGTHFLWHLLNSVLLMLVNSLMINSISEYKSYRFS